MVIMQKGNRQIRVKESDVDYMKAKGYVVVISDTAEQGDGGEATKRGRKKTDE